MRTLGETALWSFFDTRMKAQPIKSATIVRKALGRPVMSYLDLATYVAELQFRNPDFVLMFRGQSGDYRNLKGNTMLKPSLFRSTRGSKLPPGPLELTRRFRSLERAETCLVREYRRADMLGIERIERHQMLRWAILQHYEVCPTPLLDVTQSLRIAASFASQDVGTTGYLFVIAIPNLSGAITASAEAGLQIIRLASVCPPTAIRPHIQEGYLLGEYPDMANLDQKRLYGSPEIDFGRRLVAKFKFRPSSFWKDDTFPKIAKEALYPHESDDPLYRLTRRVKTLAKC